MKGRRMKRRPLDAGIRWATGRSGLGWVLAARSPRGVCAILMGDSRDAVELEVRERFPGARPLDIDPQTRGALHDAVALVERPSGELGRDLDLRGTPFQRRVWRALRDVPPGTTTTYAALASRLGSPGSARAVGAACAANPLAVAVPCHRVIRADGSLSGYRWGLDRKAELLRREAPPAALRREEATDVETEPAA